MLDVTCSADFRYAPHSAAMLDSVLANAGGEAVRVHYLHGPRFRRRDRRRLDAMVRAGGAEIRFHEVRPRAIAGLPRWEYIPRVMWYRVLLPELLPDVGRVLYLDVDTIVVDSLAPLASLDLDAMRRDGCSRALLDYARAHAAELVWPDQDTLNVVLGARRLALHPRWNLMNSILLGFPQAGEVFSAAELREARAKPAIRHFEGPAENKPWHVACRGELRELYLEHRARTPWPRVRLEGERRLRRLPRGGNPGAASSA